MSNHKLIFYGTETFDMEEHTIECYINSVHEIFITIEMPDCAPSFITLDKSTAIKFAKTLRTEINKIQS
jgi:hypothetical protein